MELTARGCCAARTVHELVPMQSPGLLVSQRPKPYLDRLAQSCRGSVPASSSGPTDQVPRANLFPKLRIRLANFPSLYCSIDQSLFTCCGYRYDPGYDLRRESTLVPQIFKGQPNTRCCFRRSAPWGCGAYLRKPAPYKEKTTLPGAPASVWGLHSCAALTV